MKASQGRIRIAYLIESLASGGAERQLVELVTRLDRSSFDPVVFIWTSPYFYGKTLEEAGVRVVRYSRKNKFDLYPALVATKWLRNGEADILHGYLNTGNLYVSLAIKLARRGVAVTSERSSQRDLSLLVRLHKRWSHRKSSFSVANSEQGRQFLINSFAVAPNHIVVIPNGVDMQRFSPVSETDRRKLRLELGWPLEAPVLLSVGRIAAPKNYIGLVDALADSGVAGSNYICWLGSEDTAYGHMTRERINGRGLSAAIEIRAPMAQIEQAYQACDIVVLNSSREGTPNVLLEAMACARPVIATDVGDVSRYLVDGETGWLVRSHDQDALVKALLASLRCSNSDRAGMGQAARQRLINLGADVDTMVRRHERLYRQLLTKRRCSDDET